MYKNLNEHEIFRTLEVYQKVLLTGKAGTGKTFLTKLIMQLAEEAGINVIATASTGIASRGLSDYGMTINTALKFGICKNFTEYESLKYLHYLNIPFLSDPMSTNLLVIDEVSMLTAETVEMIHLILEKRLQSKVLIMMVGDFLQLKPISKHGAVRYAFESSVWSGYVPVVLTENKRNEDAQWNIFLNRVRYGKFGTHDINFLESRNDITLVSDQYEVNDPTCVLLESKNSAVDTINLTKLNELPSKMTFSNYVLSLNNDSCLTYPMSNLREYFNKNKKKFLAEFSHPMLFTLKVNARVIMTKNNPKAGYVNGDMGFVESIISDEHGEILQVAVVLDRSAEDLIIITKEKFHFYHPTEKDDSNKNVSVGFIEYFPMKVAYAITTHRSQGQSLRVVYYNPKEAFTDAQVYIALSRLKEGGHLFLSTFDLRNFVSADKTALAYQQSLEDAVGLTPPKVLPTATREKSVVKPHVRDVPTPELSFDEDEIPF